MDLEYYKNFIAVAEEGSISGAAKKLSIAQPALSSQMKRLAEHYNTALIQVKRGGHHLELTDAGRRLLQRARAICAEEAFASREIADCHAGFVGTLRISLAPSLSVWFIHTYLRDFAHAYGQINYELREETGRLQEEQVLSGSSEFLLSNGPLEQPFLFQTIYRRKERLVAYFPSDSPLLPAGPAAELADFRDIPVCLTRRCAPVFLSACMSAGLHPCVLSVITTKRTALSWAEEGLGAAIAPSAEEEEVSPGLVRKVIIHPEVAAETTLSVVKGRALSQVGQTFRTYFENRLRTEAAEKEACAADIRLHSV